jgi:Ca2+-binding RTX toxin-like protein
MQYWIGDDGNNTKSAPWHQQGRQWTMYGQGGDDQLKSGMANDYLYGGAGNDRLEGLWGDDELYGEDGNDNLDGSDGDDFLDGGTGNDELRGGWGKDEIYGDLGDDVLNGNDGEDSLYGGADNDKLNGGWDTDRLDGGDGNDILQGDSFAAKGDDTLLGGNGNDILVGGSGDNVLTGGAGADRFVFAPSAKFWNLAEVAVSTIQDISDNPIVDLAGAVLEPLGEAYDAHDTITDFTVSQDKIDLSAFDFSFGSTTNALNIQTIGGDTLITFGESENNITVQGVTGITFTPDYFIV